MIFIGVMWLTTRTVWPPWSLSSRSQARFTRCAVSAKLSPPGGACSGSRRQAAAAAGHRCWISARVKPSQSPKSVSRRSSSMTTVRPSSPAAMAAVATARCNGELTTASIGAPVARRQAAAWACRVPMALSGRSHSPLKRCSGDSRVSPCRSRMVVVGSAVGLSQPSVIWLSREDDENVVSTVPMTSRRTCQQNGSGASLGLVTVPMPHDLAGRSPMWYRYPPIRMARSPGVVRQRSASCVVSAKRDGGFPHPHCQCLAARGGHGGREAVMHPAGEHLDCDRLSPGWAYLLQVAAFDPAGELGQRRFQYIQITDHAPVVELLAIHHDLDPVVMIMQLPLWPGQSRHDVESTDASAQPDLTGHRQYSCRSQERHASTRVLLGPRLGTPRLRGRRRRRECTAVPMVVRTATQRPPGGAWTESRSRTAGPAPWKLECCG